ncbi:MAG: malate dehydrogenase [Halobacteria archaeon]
MKLGFVGAGRLGSTAALACLYLTDPDEMAIVDILHDLAEGEALDMESAAAALGKPVKVVGGSDYGLLKGSDIVVVTAGVPRKPGMSRLDLVKTNDGILAKIMAGLKANCPGAVLLMVANPVDILLYRAVTAHGWPRERAIGMGTVHDTARLKGILLAMGAKRADPVVLGEHGDTMFPSRSLSKVSGVGVPWNEVVPKLRERAMEVIKRKGATTTTPGTVIALMVRTVVQDRREETVTSVLLRGEYGLSGVALSVPCVLGRRGLVTVVEKRLPPDEMKALQASAEALKAVIRDLEAPQARAPAGA